MNILLEGASTMPYFTDVDTVLKAIGVAASTLDWYISDVETNVIPPGLPDGDGWLAGETLATVLSHPGLQFMWGVFSAFPSGTRFDVEQAPVADGNPDYWRDDGTLEPQLDGALFELTCWDSSAAILVGITQEQALRLGSTYPEAKPLRMNTQEVLHSALSKDGSS